MQTTALALTMAAHLALPALATPAAPVAAAVLLLATPAALAAHLAARSHQRASYQAALAACRQA
jgi:hypothetical protein